MLTPGRRKKKGEDWMFVTATQTKWSDEKMELAMQECSRRRTWEKDIIGRRIPRCAALRKPINRNGLCEEEKWASSSGGKQAKAQSGIK
jgi:hypothetical protein